MIQKENNKNMKNENTNSTIIENDLFNSSQQKKMPKNNLFIETDFKGNKKYKKNTNIKNNKKTNKKNKVENYNHNVNISEKNTKMLIQKYFEDKEKDSIKYKDNKNENTAKTYNYNEQGKILYSNNNLNLNKNSRLRNITSNLNFNIFSLRRENNT